jgi:predicted nucleic acid-binding protein
VSLLAARRIVVTDANVLINLIHVDALAIVAGLSEYEFVVLDAVAKEITDEQQAFALQTAFDQRHFRRDSLTEPDALSLFAELVQVMGRGEAASLALAWGKNWYLACDEKRVFRRKAVELLGEERLLTTPGIIVLCIRQGLIAVNHADQMKAILETKRFKMTFRSFRDVT